MAYQTNIAFVRPSTPQKVDTTIKATRRMELVLVNRKVATQPLRPTKSNPNRNTHKR